LITLSIIYAWVSVEIIIFAVSQLSKGRLKRMFIYRMEKI